jgi:hypothetical protein
MYDLPFSALPFSALPFSALPFPAAGMLIPLPRRFRLIP